MYSLKKHAWLLLAVFGLQGCNQVKEQYYWGRYENLIYQMYVQPGKATPEIQIDQLTVDIQKAENMGKTIAPGVYAHLGFMYALQGSMVSAEAAFEREVSIYPESKVLIEGLLARAASSRSKKGSL